MNCISISYGIFSRFYQLNFYGVTCQLADILSEEIMEVFCEGKGENTSLEVEDDVDSKHSKDFFQCVFTEQLQDTEP